MEQQILLQPRSKKVTTRHVPWVKFPCLKVKMRKKPFSRVFTRVMLKTNILHSTCQKKVSVDKKNLKIFLKIFFVLKIVWNVKKTKNNFLKFLGLRIIFWLLFYDLRAEKREKKVSFSFYSMREKIPYLLQTRCQDKW